MLIIIPARGGSKTVRRKNLQPVAGKPLFLHVSETAREAFPDARIVVSTDDSEIASVALVHGFEVHHRSQQAASDTATIRDVVAEVIADTLTNDGILCVQPTVPQITVDQLRDFVELNIARPHVAGTAHRHITWQSGTPLTERVNRQENVVWPVDEIGVFWWPSWNRDDPELVHELEGVTDIDSWADLEQVRREMDPATVVFRFRANKQIGAGHLHRCLALAAELQNHRIVFWPVESEPWVHLHIWSDWPEGAEITGNVVLVNDVLDTTINDVLPYKQAGWKVVNLEDHGTGGRYADLVVNALYHPRREDEFGEYVYGPKWAVLRPEFMALPDFQIREGTPRVLGLFGGTDPNNMTDRFAERFPAWTTIRPGDDISVAAQMMNHDILVTSAGRTVYEAAAVGIPTVTVAQNAREASHSHLDGTVYLGLAGLVGMDEISETVDRLWGQPQLREELSQRGRRLVDGKGARRIAHRINGLLEGL